MELQPTGEMYTLYLSDDGERYDTAEKARDRDKVVNDRALAAQWPQYNLMDVRWYWVLNVAELQVLATLKRQQCGAVESFPALVRWEYDGNSRWDPFYALPFAHITALLAFVETIWCTSPTIESSYAPGAPSCKPSLGVPRAWPAAFPPRPGC